MSINSNYKMLQKFYTYRKCILTWTQILTLRAGDSRMALGQGLHSRMGGPSEDSHLFPFHSRMAPILTTRRTNTCSDRVRVGLVHCGVQDPWQNGRCTQHSAL